jgi:hypothetical protein
MARVLVILDFLVTLLEKSPLKISGPIHNGRCMKRLTDEQNFFTAS